MIRKQKGNREIMGHTHHRMSCLKVKENQPKKKEKKDRTKALSHNTLWLVATQYGKKERGKRSLMKALSQQWRKDSNKQQWRKYSEKDGGKY